MILPQRLYINPDVVVPIICSTLWLFRQILPVLPFKLSRLLFSSSLNKHTDWISSRSEFNHHLNGSKLLEIDLPENYVGKLILTYMSGVILK